MQHGPAPISPPQRYALVALLIVLAALSGTAAVLGAFFILVNAAARSPDKVFWVATFYIAFAAGAPVCWLSIKGMVRVWKRPDKQMTRETGMESA